MTKGIRQRHLYRPRALWTVVALAAILTLCSYLRVRMLGMPLERDEGEFAYAGLLILHGINPYNLCYSMKLPGTAAAYAFIMSAFGQSASAIHLGLLIVNAAVTLVLFFLGRRLFGLVEALVACAVFGLLSLDTSVLGLAAHATQFVLLPVLLGLYVLLAAVASRRLWLFFLSGLLLGIGFLMKQPAIVFAAFALWYLKEREPDWHKAGLQMGALITGALLPIAALSLFMWRSGLFDIFWFWNFGYPLDYISLESLNMAADNLIPAVWPIILHAPFIWIFAGAGMRTVLWSPRARSYAGFLRGFAVFSLLSVSPGLYFRQHYFVLLLPAAALLCGVTAGALRSHLQASERWHRLAPLPVLLVCAALAWSLWEREALFFRMDYASVSRAIYGMNPFPEAQRIADYLKQHTTDEDRIAVIGSEPEIYFYSERLSATGYIYMYPLMEPRIYSSVMQKRMIEEIEDARPKYIVFINDQTSWLYHSYSDKTVFTWSTDYVKAHYKLVGLADMGVYKTIYHWKNPGGTPPSSSITLEIFERTD